MKCLHPKLVQRLAAGQCTTAELTDAGLHLRECAACREAITAAATRGAMTLGDTVMLDRPLPLDVRPSSRPFLKLGAVVVSVAAMASAWSYDKWMPAPPPVATETAVPSALPTVDLPPAPAPNSSTPGPADAGTRMAPQVRAIEAPAAPSPAPTATAIPRPSKPDTTAYEPAAVKEVDGRLIRTKLE